MLVEPGDINVSKIEIKNHSGDKCYNITAQCVQIDIYEDIFSPSIEAYLLIADGISLRSRFPIVGEEYVEFEFQTKDAQKRKLKLFVIDIFGVQLETNAHIQAYRLKLVSEEVLNSERQLISMKIKATPVDIIKKIMKENLQTQKQFQYDQTIGIDDMVIDQLSPFQAIDMVRRRSISRKYKSSSFCFFENRDGYALFTLEGLFDRNKGNIGDRIFFYDNNVNEDIRTVNYRNVLGYEHVCLADTLAQMNRTRVTSFDIVTGEIKQVEYGDDVYKKIDSKGSDIVSSNFNDRYRKKVAIDHLVPIDSSLPEYQLPEKIGFNNAFVNKITSNLLQLWVYGDSSISCGDVIEVKLPEFSGTTAAKTKDKYVSGNYMISKCRHMIHLSLRSTYTMSFELIKGNYLSSV